MQTCAGAVWFKWAWVVIYTFFIRKEAPLWNLHFPLFFMFTHCCSLVIQTGRSTQQQGHSPCLSAPPLTIQAASCHVWMTLLSPSTAQQCEMAGKGDERLWKGDYFEHWHLHVKWELATLLCATSSMLTSISGRLPKGLACYFILCCRPVKTLPT